MNKILNQPNCRRVSTNRPNRVNSQLVEILEGVSGPTPAGKTFFILVPQKPIFGGRGHDSFNKKYASFVITNSAAINVYNGEKRWS